ncbi:MAG: signal recognition particle protein [Megasphaera sp.]|jgi:signal recognition particle subunit SRP54|uniref:signal recognition particle protein n=1 Tax=Megasphaera sueciensis TaxID=349094 RepID=UPI003CFD19B9|nr:signal recognition particle protein [Megasphaera sp.]MCI1822437.1 signal recognition particle protein [Megasphaera sp.]
MPFESLSERFQLAFKKLRGKGKLSEEDVNEALKEMRRALLEADVNFNVTKDFIKKIKEKTVGEEVFGTLNAAQTVIKIVRDELAELLGGTQSRITISSRPPTIIMLVGLQGAGKTTTAAKLARMLKSQGKSPLLVAGDVYRPAAISQLQVLGEQLDIPVYTEEGSKDPVQISQNSIPFALSHLKDIIIVDTAGRLHVNETLMDELVRIKETVHPHEIMLVVDAMTGQDAVTAASAFDQALGIDGIIMTKLDGDARGGAALSIKAVTGKPIKFIGVSEKLDGLEEFHPDRYASRILDLGDVETIIEKAQAAFDEESMEEMKKTMKSGSFTFDDFLSQLNMVKKMGNMSSLVGLIPGIGKYKKEIDKINMDGKEFKHLEAIIQSMTTKERSSSNPKMLIKDSRKRRIAKGSGTRVQDVNRLIKQFTEMQKMMKMAKKQQGKKRSFMPRLPFHM